MIFVQKCARCNAKSNQGFCQTCFDALPFNHNHCACCALPLPSSQQPLLCGECLKQTPYFDKVRSPFVYQAPISDLIKNFKHNAQLNHGRLLAELFAKQIKRYQQIDLIIPIPLQNKRIAQRGFNQSSEIARLLAKKLAIPWCSNSLLRNNDNHQQQGTSRKIRRKNIRNAFYLAQPLKPKIKNVAIIDDVLTTGATANEAAKVLKHAGIDYVEIWTLARTPKNYLP